MMFEPLMYMGCHKYQGSIRIKWSYSLFNIVSGMQEIIRCSVWSAKMCLIYYRPYYRRCK